MISLTLPLPPNRGNDSRHWRAKLKDKDEWQKHAAVVLANSRLRPLKPLESYTVLAIVYTTRKADWDNCAARLKPALDLLCGLPKRVKGHGVCYTMPRWLVDDGPDHLTWGTVVPAVDAKRPRLELLLDVPSGTAPSGVTPPTGCSMD